MRYAVVIEKGERNDSAYVPDLPGCVSVRRHPGRGQGPQSARRSNFTSKAEIRAPTVRHPEGRLRVPLTPSALAGSESAG